MNGSRLLPLLLFCGLLGTAAGLAAQSAESPEIGAALVGTWVSTEPILVNFKFSLTFTGTDYRVDCSLGQTTGVYTASEDKIFFTPLKIGINSGDVGKVNTWSYSFWDADSFQLKSGAISVRLYRKGSAAAPGGSAVAPGGSAEPPGGSAVPPGGSAEPPGMPGR